MIQKNYNERIIFDYVMSLSKQPGENIDLWVFQFKILLNKTFKEFILSLGFLEEAN